MVTRRPDVTTIAEVAARAGVSASTVSRVMNGRFAGDPEVADRVRTAASELRYAPNHLARSFAMGQTSAIAFLVPDLANPSSQAVLAALSSAAAADGYRVLVADSAESATDEPLLAADIRRRSDALVLCAPRMSDAELIRSAEALAPVVLLNRACHGLPAPTLSVDSRAGFEHLTRHLYSLGHRRFVYVEGPDGVANRNRINGIGDFTATVQDLSLVRVPGGGTSEDGLAAVNEVVGTGATAAMAFNDLVAVGLVHGLLERGVAVPGDVSVTGFDDIPFARFMSPSLTTQSVPHQMLGELGWARMRALLRDEPPEHDLLIQPRLEVRRSTAPPPSPRG